MTKNALIALFSTLFSPAGRGAVSASLDLMPRYTTMRSARPRPAAYRELAYRRRRNARKS